MQLGIRLRSQRGWLAGSATVCYLLALGLILAGLARGGSNVMARGGIEVVDGILCLVVVVSFALGMAPTNRRYFRLIQASMALFAITFLAGGMFDLGSGRVADAVAGIALLAGAVVLLGAVVEYVSAHHTPHRGMAALLDLAILVVAVLALVAPLVLTPLAAQGGLRAFSIGAAWTVELALFVGTLWTGVGWLRSSEQMDFVFLIVGLGGAFLVASIHVGFEILGQPSIPWWLQALYGPGLIVVALAPDMGVTPEGILVRGGERWSAVQAYVPYLPACLLVGAALAVAVTGHQQGNLGRGLVAGALTVSALLVIRQGILLRANRRLLDQRSVQALRDPLTGLLNRRAFQEDMRQLIYQSARDGSSFALLLVDLDGLKAINDGPGGHSGGDVTLMGLARALSRSGRREDRSYRLGGDEFAVLFPSADRQTAVRSVGQARENLLELAPRATFSFGIAEFDSDGTEPGSLFEAADRELYRAKVAGRKLEAPAQSRLAVGLEA